MRRSFLPVVLGSLLAVIVGACARDVVPTSPTPGARSNGPVEIGGSLITIDPNRFASITAGTHFTCARRNDNNVYCWGLNHLGQTGWTSRTSCASGLQCIDRPKLVTMSGGVVVKGVQLDAGADHACALDPNLAAVCWGSGNEGQLGFGFGLFGVPGEPMPVVGGHQFTSIAAGANSTCGTTANQGVLCWGILGNTTGTTGGASVPTQRFAYSGYHAITVGDTHACAFLVVSSNRSVDCFGNNAVGQLALDPRLVRQAPFPVPSQFGTSVLGVTTERSFTCVDQLNGTVQCAGLGNSGQLGNGSFFSTGTPQTVGSGRQLHGVTTGVSHACALDADNAAWCWGFGDKGQLGNNVIGSQAFFATPQAVRGNLRFSAIAAGQSHTCAISVDNAIYCWGGNGSGQLGIGGSSTTLVAATPIRALDPKVVY